jgi:hypothetical protein
MPAFLNLTRTIMPANINPTMMTAETPNSGTPAITVVLAVVVVWVDVVGVVVVMTMVVVGWLDPEDVVV